MAPVVAIQGRRPERRRTSPVDGSLTVVAAMQADVVETRLPSVIQEIMETHAGNAAAAAKALEAACRADQGLFNELMEPLTAKAAWEAIRFRIQRDRRTVWTAPNYQPGGNGDRVVDLARGSLLMFPLPGGVLLRDADKGAVQTAAHFYNEQASDMAHKARWLVAIAKKLPKGKRVADVFDEAKLASLKDQTND